MTQYTPAQIATFVSDGFDKAKAGDALNVYKVVADWYDAGHLPSKSHYAFGWIIYYAMHQSADYEITLRKQMLARYLRLSTPRPHKLHSMILTEAIRLYKNVRNAEFNRRPGDELPSFSLIKFAGLWNLANLRPGDWRRHDVEGKTVSATVEKLITSYVDEAERTKTLPAPEFSEVMTRALNEYADSANILSQQASLLLLENNLEGAASLLRRATLMAPSKSYLWQRLAALVSPASERHLHIALLYKAVAAPGPDNFKGRIRISLAQAWILGKNYPQALFELQQVRRTYEANGWHLSPAFERAEKMIPAGTAAEDPTPLYKKVEHMAQEYLYGELPEVMVVKNYHKPAVAGQGYGRPRVAWRVADAEGRTFWLQPSRFGIDDNHPLQTPLRVRICAGKIVDAKL